MPEHKKIEARVVERLEQIPDGAARLELQLHPGKPVARLCLDEIDNRATVIVLGDARTDVLKELYDRSKRVIWLNPEPRAMWNTGDSEMRHYAPYCHQVDECSTLAHLERIVGRLLRAF